MEIFIWILGSTFLMSLLAFIGIITLYLREDILKKVLTPLVAFSAGALMGGAVLHLLPTSIKEMGLGIPVFLWILIGFTIFFLLEQFMQWHHCHRPPSQHKKSSSYLLLIADSVHKFIGGLSIAGAFLVNIEAGIIAWFAAAAHEIPQELGQYGVLLHGGWNRKKALFINFGVGLTIMLGGLTAYFAPNSINTDFLLPFAVGIFIYIAASDLIPEIKHEHEDVCKNSKVELKLSLFHFTSFLAGILLLLAIKLLFGGY